MAQDIHELSIVLAIGNHNQAILTLDFLKGGGIVPADWELQRPPVLTVGSAQVIFKNGVNIVASSQTVTFSESLDRKILEDVEIARVAGKYVSTLPNLDYLAIGINPKYFATFENQPDGARKFINETLLSPGAWQNIGPAPVQARVDLIYTLEGRQLRLLVAEAGLQLPDKQQIPAVLFAGNFNYDLDGESGEARVRSLHQRLANWQADLETYRDIVNNKFLAKKPEKEKVLLIRDAS
ncbi:hypothetical protein [Microseira sp. BLCC-F43]|jgi:hypothetical protein|uniref:hypothetical protein n=1 Tax=Microseira sp. BLCC-F43 TaxID=3153602 RepID=UPI0035BA6AE0